MVVECSVILLFAPFKEKMKRWRSEADTPGKTPHKKIGECSGIKSSNPTANRTGMHLVDGHASCYFLSDTWTRETSVFSVWQPLARRRQGTCLAVAFFLNRHEHTFLRQELLCNAGTSWEQGAAPIHALDTQSPLFQDLNAAGRAWGWLQSPMKVCVRWRNQPGPWIAELVTRLQHMTKGSARPSERQKHGLGIKHSWC